tara:strand:- start:606 stop:1148 length:543 start_codon:yes stop_codon:yes gene_type:complete
MKTIVLDNVLSQKELFFMYREIVSCAGWKINGLSSIEEDKNKFNSGPLLMIKSEEITQHYPFSLWGQTLVYRIHNLLTDKNIGIPTSVSRMWFNVTYSGEKTQHWLHRDDEQNSATKSILLFMTPIWQPDWRGSFYVDGEEFKFKPGSAVIFDSQEYHKGETPASAKYSWQRLTCNILVK